MTRALAAVLALTLGATVLPFAGSHAVEGADATWDERELLAKVNTWGKVEKGAWFSNEVIDDGYEQLGLKISAKKKPGIRGYCLATVGLWDYTDGARDPWTLLQKARIATKYTRTFKHRYVNDIRIGNTDIAIGEYKYLYVRTNGKCRNVRATLTRDIFLFQN
jgi:hypothetical protein